MLVGGRKGFRGVGKCESGGERWGGGGIGMGGEVGGMGREVGGGVGRG